MTDPKPVRSGSWTGVARSGGGKSDRALVVAVALLSIPLTAGAVIAGGGRDWQWWQWLVVLLLAADLGGGMLANMLASTKPAQPAPGKTEWRTLGFAALHFHLPVMALMLPGWMSMQAAWLGYIWMLGGAVLLLGVPARLRLPAGLAITAIGTILLSRLIPLDSALGWMPLIVFLKILAGHMVPLDSA